MYCYLFIKTDYSLIIQLQTYVSYYYLFSHEEMQQRGYVGD